MSPRGRKPAVMAGLRGRAWVRQVRRDWIEGAAVWERWEPQLLYSLAAVDPHLVRALDVRPRQRVLDFGCGSGEPALAIAPLVAPGSVVGLDLSPAMLAIARRRAKLRGVRNVRFRRGDIARIRIAGSFDRAVARYGLMFVDDIPLALARLRRLLKPRGRIALAVWGPADRNPWYVVRARAARPFLTEPPPDPEHVPGPLRLARPGLLPRLLRGAGFRNVQARGVSAPLVYRGEEEYVESSAQGALRVLHDSLSRRRQVELSRRLARGIRPFRDGALLRIPGFAWVVSARR